MSQKISALDLLASGLHADDLFELVDVSDGTMAPSGTNKRVKFSLLQSTILSPRSVTFGTMPAIAQNRILGRVAAGSGDAAGLTAAEVRTLINVEDGATAGADWPSISNKPAEITGLATEQILQRNRVARSHARLLGFPDPAGLVCDFRAEIYKRHTLGENLADIADTPRGSSIWLPRNGVLTEITDDEPPIGDDGLETYRQSTNLITHSDDLTNAAWAKFTSNVNANQDGIADEVSVTGASGGVYQTVTVTPSTEYTWQFKAKLNDLAATNFKFAIYNQTALSWIGVDIVPTVTLSTGGYSLVTYTFTAPVGCTEVRAYPFRPGALVTGSAFIKECQLEEGGAATAYIPTTAVAASRDWQQVVIPLSDSGLDLTQPFHVYCEFERVGDQSVSLFPYLFEIDDGSYNNVIGIFYGVPNQRYAGIRRSPTQTTQEAFATPTGVIKAALSVGASAWKIAVNGTLSAGLSNTIPPGLNRLLVGWGLSGGRDNWRFRELAIAAGALSDQALQDLTS